jgi:hypothetical protein
MRSPANLTTTATKVSKVTNTFIKFGSFVAFVIFVVRFALPATAAVIDPDTRVMIRTYESTALPGDRASALAAATEILEGAGLEVKWVACDAVFVRRDDDPCVAPLAANELAIRFVRLPPSQGQTNQIALGYSLVDTRLRAGSLATVYVDRVTALAVTCHLDVQTLLGRAIAHEVGHLLLGTANHAPAGLMRAAWSQDALRHERPGEWVFTQRDARAMRDAVRMRTARQLAAARLGE